MNPVYQIRAQLDTLSSMASKWPPFEMKLGILPLAPKCSQHTKFQTIRTIGIDFGIWGIFVLVGKLLMHILFWKLEFLEYRYPATNRDGTRPPNNANNKNNMDCRCDENKRSLQ